MDWVSRMSAVSEYAKAKERLRNKEIYNWYKAKGICPKCKTAWAEPGRVYCRPCLDVKLAKTMKYGSEYNAQKCKERRERLKEKGLCVRCGKPAVKNRVLCSKCAQKNAEAQQVRKMKKRIARENEKEIRGNGKGDNT